MKSIEESTASLRYTNKVLQNSRQMRQNKPDKLSTLSEGNGQSSQYQNEDGPAEPTGLPFDRAARPRLAVPQAPQMGEQVSDAAGATHDDSPMGILRATEISRYVLFLLCSLARSAS